MIRNILAVIAAPIIWGVVGVPANQVILSFFPDAAAGNLSATMLVTSVIASFIYSLIAGAAAAAIALRDFSRIGLFAGLAVLLVGLGVQIGNWPVFPVWYHSVFLIALVPFTMLGAGLITSRR